MPRAGLPELDPTVADYRSALDIEENDRCPHCGDRSYRPNHFTDPTGRIYNQCSNCGNLVRSKDYEER